MKQHIKILFFLSVLIPFNSAFSQSKISNIQFKGIKKTNESFINYFVQSKENMPFDSLMVIKDAQRLRNLQLFREVNFKVVDSEQGKIIVFNSPELKTFSPIINFGGVTDNFWFQIGAMDYHWLGMGYTLGGFYRYYDRHSFNLYFKGPYLFNQYWGLAFDLANIATIEPAYFFEGSAEYNVDRMNIISNVIYNFSIHNRIEFGGGYLYEQYKKNETKSGPSAPGPDQKAFNKYLVKLMLHNKYIDYYYQYVSGYSNEFNLENVRTQHEKDLFWKVLNITSLYVRYGQKSNLAFRLRMGASTNKDSPFVPFVLDNYINVRGSGNRVSRGTAEFTFNSEYRYTMLEHVWGIMQGVFFMDMSAWRPAAGKYSEMFEDKNNVTFGGLGIRLFFKKFNNFIFRMDFGKSVTRNKGSGIVFGAGQYF